MFMFFSFLFPTFFSGLFFPLEMQDSSFDLDFWSSDVDPDIQLDPDCMLCLNSMTSCDCANTVVVAGYCRE